jgi:hypothetical protein
VGTGLLDVVAEANRRRAQNLDGTGPFDGPVTQPQLDDGINRRGRELRRGLAVLAVGKLAANHLDLEETNVADVHKFSEQVIDLAERLADVADAAGGKGVRKGGATRWVLLPAAGAAGAGLYALATSGSLTRQAKGVVNQAKTRASDLPTELLGLVRQQSRTSSGGRTAAQSSGNRSKRRRTTSSAARKTRSTRSN